MEIHDKAFWDELGVAWRAAIPDEGLFAARIEARLRLQGAVLTAASGAAVAAALFGLGLGGWTLWSGWSTGAWHFVSRGATLIAIASLALFAFFVLQGASGRRVQSVRENLQLSIARMERLVRAADLGVAALVVLGVGGLIGYGLRARLGHPAQVSPLEDLLTLAVIGLALLWFRWSQSRSLTAARHVSRTFDTEDSSGDR